MKQRLVLIVVFLFWSISIFAQDASNSLCIKDTCIAVLENDKSVLKRIVMVKSRGRNMYTIVGPKSYGFGTSEKNISISIKFDFAKAFYKGYAVVGVNMLYGVIDSLGKVVIPIKYKAISNVNEGFAFFSINGDKLDGVVDIKGKEYHIDPLMGSMSLKTGATITSMQDSPLGTFVCDDIQLIPYLFSEGYAIINNRVMNNQMKFLFTSTYILDKKYNEGVVKISWKSSSGNTLYGFMDTQGKIVVRPIYLSAEDFVNGKSEVTSGNPIKPLKQIIDKKGIVLK